MGRKKRPFYRLVVLDSRKRRDGAYLANLGYYNPFTDPHQVELHADDIISWLSKGATVSETARSLLKSEGVLYRYSLIKQGLATAEVEQKMVEWVDAAATRRRNAADAAKAKVENARSERVKREEEAKTKAAEEAAKEAAEQAAKEAAKEAAEEAAKEAAKEAAEAESEEAPAEAEAAAEAPAEEAPVEEAPVEEAPAKEAAAEAPAEEAPTEEAPTEETPTEEAAVAAEDGKEKAKDAGEDGGK